MVRNEADALYAEREKTPGKTPADAGVAEIVDDAAEDVGGFKLSHGASCPEEFWEGKIGFF